MEAVLVKPTVTPRPPEQKPIWRGWIHAVAAPVAVAMGGVLITLAQTAEARWACLIFMLTSCLLFGNSALYHRGTWSLRVSRLLRRVDHANIFLLIAGTYTPVALLALPQRQGLILLSVVWGGALLGVAFRVFWLNAPRWSYVPIYLALGWAAILYFGPLYAANAAMMTLMLIGGLLYTLGALTYGLKKPNLLPGSFGFHEVFHACTAAAFLCHWTAVLLIALHPVA